MLFIYAFNPRLVIVFVAKIILYTEKMALATFKEASNNTP